MVTNAANYLQLKQKQLSHLHIIIDIIIITNVPGRRHKPAFCLHIIFEKNITLIQKTQVKMHPTSFCFNCFQFNDISSEILFIHVSDKCFRFYCLVAEKIKILAFTVLPAFTI